MLPLQTFCTITQFSDALTALPMAMAWRGVRRLSLKAISHIYINDLPDEAITSTVRLFADDCILYRSIKTQQESTLLQTDLNSI